MATYTQLITANPVRFFWSIYQSLIYLTILLVERLLLPTACRAVTLRTQIVRCIYGAFLANFWDLLFKAPPNLRAEDYRSIRIGSVLSVVIPRNADLSGKSLDRERSIVLLYGHGGGYLFGEPLMYISTYKRWIKAAADKGIKLTIVSVDYRRSDRFKFPACRDDFLSVYYHLIDEMGVPASHIIFGGDSAGGGLSAMSVLHARKSGRPLPGGVILVSPWLDLKMDATLHSPAMSTDFLITFSKDNPILVNSFLPQGIEPSDPQVSPLFDKLHDLPPQLVFAGTAEVLLPDSDTWVRRSREAGNSVEYILGQGQMHTQVSYQPLISSLIFSMQLCHGVAALFNHSTSTDRSTGSELLKTPHWITGPN